jgi:hypothetical protein
MDNQNSMPPAAINESPDYIRWYDRQPKLSLACKLLFRFSDEIKSLISEAVLIIIVREFKQNKKPEQVRTLGGEKILGLHKSKNRRREYDVNPHLHQAMNEIYLLSEGDRDFMAEHILSMVHYIQHYLQTHQIIKTQASLEEVPSSTCVYLQSGNPSATLFLKHLRLEFCQKLKSGGKLAVANSGLEIIENDTRTNGADMKVRYTDQPL